MQTLHKIPPHFRVQAPLKHFPPPYKISSLHVPFPLIITLSLRPFNQILSKVYRGDDILFFGNIVKED